MPLPSHNHIHNFIPHSNHSRNDDFPQKAARWFPYYVTSLSDDCDVIRAKLGFGRYPRPSMEETAFPLAFSIIFHTDLDQAGQRLSLCVFLCVFYMCFLYVTFVRYIYVLYLCVFYMCALYVYIITLALTYWGDD